MSLRVAIFEDEPLAVAALERGLARWDSEARVVLVAGSVRAAVQGLRRSAEPDLIFSDVRLSDGLSLAVFDEVRPACPAIFTTAYDEYVIRALERNAIDYLLKPIEGARFAQAMNKYVRLREHFGGKLAALVRDLRPGAAADDRILARSGPSYVVIPTERAAWFTTEHKLTILATRDGARFVVDEPLGELDARLGTRVFRLNRQYLALAEGIASFRSGGKGRLVVTLAPAAEDEVVVAQETAGKFRAWMKGESGA